MARDFFFGMGFVVLFVGSLVLGSFALYYLGLVDSDTWRPILGTICALSALLTITATGVWVARRL